MQTGEKMTHQIKYNNQRDNFVIAGIKGSSQCFATSAWMLLSFYSAIYQADDDNGLKQYIADITASGASHEYEWEAQRNEIQKYLDAAGVKGRARLGIDIMTGYRLTSIDDLRTHINKGPVIIGTSKMAGLPGGHLILGIGNAANGAIICHDPYGNANTGYTDQNGAGVVYDVKMFDAKYPNGPVRAIWLEQS